MKVIDDYIDKLKRYLTPLLRWSDQLLEAVEKYPGYRTKLNSGSCVCNANAEVSLGLDGTPYDYQTLENLQEVVDVETVALVNII